MIKEKGRTNSVILILGRIHAASANHDIREFTVRIYNTVDMLPHVQGEFNDKNTKGYLESEDLDAVARNLESDIAVNFRHRKVNLILYEEESD